MARGSLFMIVNDLNGVRKKYQIEQD